MCKFWITLLYIYETEIEIEIEELDDHDIQAIDMVGRTSDSIPFIFLITDGSVEDEREICNMVKGHIVDGELNSPRICTFGIGSYINQYFLQMLANIGRGHYDSAYDVGQFHQPQIHICQVI